MQDFWKFLTSTLNSQPLATLFLFRQVSNIQYFKKRCGSWISSPLFGRQLGVWCVIAKRPNPKGFNGVWATSTLERKPIQTHLTAFLFTGPIDQCKRKKLLANFFSFNFTSTWRLILQSRSANSKRQLLSNSHCLCESQALGLFPGGSLDKAD